MIVISRFRRATITAWLVILLPPLAHLVTIFLIKLCALRMSVRSHRLRLTNSTMLSVKRLRLAVLASQCLRLPQLATTGLREPQLFRQRAKAQTWITASKLLRCRARLAWLLAMLSRSLTAKPCITLLKAALVS